MEQTQEHFEINQQPSTGYSGEGSLDDIKDTTTTDNATSEETTATHTENTEETTEKTAVADGSENPTQDAVNTRLDTEAEVAKDLAAKGLDFNEIANEYDSKGELSAETLKKLEDAGYPKAIVDNYIRGLELDVQNFVSTVHGFAGGEENFNQLTKFVQSKGNEAINAFNNAINSGNLAQIQMVLYGLQSEMKATYGTKNRVIMGNGMVSTPSEGFETKQEMIDAMVDKRYGKDMKYTREVERKAMKSNLF